MTSATSQLNSTAHALLRFVAFGTNFREHELIPLVTQDVAHSSPTQRDQYPLLGGCLMEVQMLAGHRALSTTQRYIDADVEAQRKVVDLV